MLWNFGVFVTVLTSSRVENELKPIDYVVDY